MNNFGLLMNKIQQSLPGLIHRLHNSYYMEPQVFLFDKCNALIYVGVDGQDSGNKPKESSPKNIRRFGTTAATKQKDLSPVNKNNKELSPERGQQATKLPKAERDFITEEKNNDYKDIADLLAGVISGMDDGGSDTERIDVSQSRLNKLLELQNMEAIKKAPPPLSPSDFTEITKNIFGKFRYALVRVLVYTKI